MFGVESLFEADMAAFNGGTDGGEPVVKAGMRLERAVTCKGG